MDVSAEPNYETPHFLYSYVDPGSRTALPTHGMKGEQGNRLVFNYVVGDDTTNSDSYRATAHLNFTIFQNLHVIAAEQLDLFRNKKLLFAKLHKDDAANIQLLAEEKAISGVKEAERKKAERKEAERKEAERKEAERKKAERKEAERKEVEREEAAHREGGSEPSVCSIPSSGREQQGQSGGESDYDDSEEQVVAQEKAIKQWGKREQVINEERGGEDSDHEIEVERLKKVSEDCRKVSEGLKRDAKPKKLAGVLPKRSAEGGDKKLAGVFPKKKLTGVLPKKSMVGVKRGAPEPDTSTKKRLTSGGCVHTGASVKSKKPPSGGPKSKNSKKPQSLSGGKRADTPKSKPKSGDSSSSSSSDSDDDTSSGDSSSGDETP
jgi:hypothetical protein